MKLVRYETSGQNKFGYLSDAEQHIHPFDDEFNLTEILAGGEIPNCNSETLPLDSVRLLAPIASPQKVICVGKNYADHAREMGGEPPSLPVIFNKFPTAINDPNSDVVLPLISNKVDYEAELVVVIGKGGRNIRMDDVDQHIFGYCCGNDISARDWQKGKPGGQWLLGKTFDGFAPIGPYLVTASGVDSGNLDIQLRLNGEVMQNANTSEFIFKIDYLIAHLSQFCQLSPGDLIFTGTPAGVGAGRNPQVFLKPGDVLQVEIEGLGVLQNQMV